MRHDDIEEWRRRSACRLRKPVFTIAPAGGHQRRLARGTDFGVATRQVAVQHCFRDRTSGIWPKNWRLGCRLWL
jgi:hypothetical protein